MKRLRGWVTKESGRGKPTDWHLQDITTSLQVPLPRLSPDLESNGISINHVNIPETLASLSWEIFEGPQASMSLSELRESFKYLVLPQPLASALMEAYTDFARAIGDSFLFDHVLDLHELFAAVHRLFTNELRKQRNELAPGKTGDALWASRKLSFLSADKVEEIASLIDLIENTLSHRMEMGYRHSRRWEDAVGMHGGLNKLVNATDVLIKCGLSIIRRVVDGQTDLLISDRRFETRDEFRARVGGASRINHRSNAVVRRFEVGDPNTNFIAELALSPAHLAQPTFMLAHIHEAGHILGDRIRRDVLKSPGLPSTHLFEACPENRCQGCALTKTDTVDDLLAQERCEEIFAEMLTYGLLCHPGEDISVAYMRYFISLYFLDAVSLEAGNSSETLRRFVECAIRAFLALDPFLVLGESAIADTYTWKLTNKPIVPAARARFIRLLKAAGPMFYDFHRFWTNEAAKQYILKTFDIIYKTSFYPVCCIWHQVEEIIGSVCAVVSKDGSKGTSPPLTDQDWLFDQVIEGFVTGNPLLRFLYDDPDAAITKERKAEGEKRAHLDAVFVIRALFREHISHTFSNEALDMSKATCYIQGAPTGVGANLCLLDRGYNGLVYADFDDRARALKERIFMLTTLWDLSTALRARALQRLMAGAKMWPDKVIEEFS